MSQFLDGKYTPKETTSDARAGSSQGLSNSNITITLEKTSADSGAARNDDLIHKYLTFTPRSKPALVDQTVKTIFYKNSTEGLFAVIESYLDRIQWTRRFHYHNDSDQPAKYEAELPTQLRYTHNESLGVNLGIGAALTRLEVSTSIEHKIFAETETTTSNTEKVTVPVDPKSSLYLYQRDWHFITKAWFISDAWAEYRTIGSGAGDDVLAVTTKQVISAPEFAAMKKPLEGELEIDVLQADRRRMPTIRKWGDLSGKARSTLSGLGVEPGPLTFWR